MAAKISEEMLSITTMELLPAAVPVDKDQGVINTIVLKSK